MLALTLLIYLQRAFLDRLRCGLQLVHIDALIAWIIHPALHGKQTRTLGAQYDMVDLFHATHLGLESQTSRGVLVLLFKPEAKVLWIQLLESVQRLPEQGMVGML